MLYEEHFTLNEKNKRAERNYYKILEEKEELLATVRPSSVSGNEKESKTNAKSDPFTNYVALIEEIETRLQNTKNIWGKYNYNLKKKEIELRESKNVLDIVYVYIWLEHKKINRFYRTLNYGKTQVYRFRDEIKSNLEHIKLKMGKNGKKDMIS